MRPALLREVVLVALDTLRANKLRSALTILGVVIGITAIVGMTSLIRGFDESLRDSIRELGPNTIFVAKFSGVSLAAGNEFAELLRRPNLTVDDATAIEKLAPSAGIVDIWLGAGGPPTQTRVFYGDERTKLARRAGRDGTLRRHQLPRAPGGPVLHRRRGVPAAQRRGARPDAVSGAVRRVGGRSRRQARACRRRGIHGRRRRRQTAVRRGLRSRPG